MLLPQRSGGNHRRSGRNSDKPRRAPQTASPTNCNGPIFPCTPCTTYRFVPHLLNAHAGSSHSLPCGMCTSSAHAVVYEAAAHPERRFEFPCLGGLWDRSAREAYQPLCRARHKCRLFTGSTLVLRRLSCSSSMQCRALSMQLVDLLPRNFTSSQLRVTLSRFVPSCKLMRKTNA